jgi:hypothetical protein
MSKLHCEITRRRNEMRAFIILYACMIFQLLCPSVHAAGMPSYTRTDYPTTGGAIFMSVGKENNDTYPDLIVISPDGAINVLPGGSGGTFGTAIVTLSNIPALIKKTYLVPTVADDFNNDGFTDICMKDTLFISTGEGNFASPKPLGLGNLQTITSADMNGDGNKDLIAIAIVYIDSTTRAAELRTYFGNGDGTFGEPVRTRIIFTDRDPEESGKVIDDNGTYHLFYAGDFTGDGVPDILLRHTYTVDMWDFPNDFTYIGSAEGTFSQRYCYYSGHSFMVEVKDVNSDGKKDIIQCGYGIIFLGDNTGIFSSFIPQFEYEDNSWIFSIDDVNGDGILDIVFVKIIDELGYGVLSTNLGNGNGYFGGKYEFSIKIPYNGWYGYGWLYEAEKIISYDFNNDGCADFVIPSYQTSNIAVVLSEKITGVLEKNKPNTSVLFQNSPNPFNSSTSIPFSISVPGEYEISIYDILGRKVATLADGFQSNGERNVIWNGRAENGMEVASGIYFCTMKEKSGKGVIVSKRLLLMK